LDDQRVARVFALQHAGQREAFGQVHRHVLQRMDGDVGAPFFERQFEFFHEEALAAHLAERAVQDLVAGGRHAQQADRVASFLQKRLHVFGLPKCQPAFARGDHDIAQDRSQKVHVCRPSEC
jgi:hypothetical protein